MIIAGALTFKMAASPFVDIFEKEVNRMMQFRKALKMQLSPRCYFSKARDENFANCEKKSSCKLHVVDLDDLK